MKNRLTKRELKQLMASFRTITNAMDVKIILSKSIDYSGTWDSEKRQIILAHPLRGRAYMPTHGFISTFFHELVHQINYDVGKYPIFHHTITFYKIKPRLGFRLTAFKAERYTDKQAKKLMAFYFPSVPFRWGYPNNNIAKTRLREYYSF